MVIYGDPPVRYDVRSVVDLKRRDLHALLDLDNPPSGEADGMLAQGDRLAAQIKLLCPTMTDAVLDEMTFRERADFHAACLEAGPPPLLESLAVLLKNRALPCDEVCEHPDCPPLRELWAMKEKLTDANPSVPAPGPTASGDSLTVSGSST